MHEVICLGLSCLWAAYKPPSSIYCPPIIQPVMQHIYLATVHCLATHTPRLAHAPTPLSPSTLPPAMPLPCRRLHR